MERQIYKNWNNEHPLKTHLFRFPIKNSKAQITLWLQKGGKGGWDFIEKKIMLKLD